MTRPKFDRKAAKDQLAKRTAESYDSKDQGMTYNRYFDRESNLPFWNPKKDVEGGHMFDVIPYPAGEFDPGVVRGMYTKGDTVYHLDIWVHQRTGPRDLQVVCPEQNFNKPCDICDFRNRLRKEGADEGDIKSLLPKRRCSYNVIVCDNGAEEDKGVQILECAHYFMEQKLATVSRKKRGGGGFIPFSDPDEGKTVKFERNKKGKEFEEWEGHGFEDREYTIDDETLDETFILDTFVILHSPEEIKAIVQEMEEGGIISAAGKSDDDNGGDKDRKKSRRERATSDDNESKGDDEKTTGRKRGMKKMETPAEKGNAEPDCPEGGTFGKDNDNYVGCDDCSVYQDCLAAKEEAEPPKRGRKRKRAPDSEEGETKNEEKSEDPKPEEPVNEKSPRRGRRRNQE